MGCFWPHSAYVSVTETVTSSCTQELWFLHRQFAADVKHVLASDIHDSQVERRVLLSLSEDVD